MERQGRGQEKARLTVRGVAEERSTQSQRLGRSKGGGGERAGGSPVTSREGVPRRGSCGGVSLVGQVQAAPGLGHRHSSGLDPLEQRSPPQCKGGESPPPGVCFTHTPASCRCRGAWSGCWAGMGVSC